MPAGSIGGVTWVKAKASNVSGQCVELAALPGGDVAVRNSRFPDGVALIFTPGEIRAFRFGMEDGEFDHVIDA
ncbi:DUF397 domain-containing protein [Kitasatospora sp. NPDC001119]